MQELLEELAEAGFPVKSVSELRTSGVRYSKAIPVLLKWLPRETEPSWLQEDIVRALSVPWARVEALGPLTDTFVSIPVPGSAREESLRWAIGNGINVLWDDARFDDLVELARDGRYGKAREMVVLGLGRSKRAEAGNVLLQLLADPVVSGHAVKALGRLRDPQARNALEQMTRDERAWVRREAERALARLA